MEKLDCRDLTLEEARLQIEQNRHTGLTTAYYLSLKRFIRQGGKSAADITKYNPALVQKLIEQEAIEQSRKVQEIQEV
jgi:hypothetical protein